MFAEATFVNIVAAMTIGARTDAPTMTCQGRNVACHTIEIPMGAFERKRRLSIVIEAPEQPAVRIVAECAIASETTVVRIVRRVAGVAGTGSLREHGRQMAFFAGGRPVHAEQRKIGEIVVVIYSVVPAAFMMTSGTVAAQLTGVGIHARVTSNAVANQPLLGDGPAMTGFAGDVRVFSTQRELGRLVVVEVR